MGEHSRDIPEQVLKSEGGQAEPTKNEPEAKEKREGTAVERTIDSIVESGMIAEEKKAELRQDLLNMHAMISGRIDQLKEQGFFDTPTEGVTDAQALEGVLNIELQAEAKFFTTKYGAEVANSIRAEMQRQYFGIFNREEAGGAPKEIKSSLDDYFNLDHVDIPDDIKSEIRLAYEHAQQEDDFQLYSKGVIVGWLVAIVAAIAADQLGVEGAAAEGTIRLIAGCGDTIGGSIGLIMKRLKSKVKGEEISDAETFALGTVVGTAVGPLVHALSEGILGPGTTQDMWRGGITASLYSNADNWGGAVGSLIKSIKDNGLKVGILEFATHPFQRANVIAVTGLMGASIGARAAGLAPETNLGAGVEGALLNNDTTIASLVYLWHNRNKVKSERKAAQAEKSQGSAPAGAAI